MTGHMNRLTIAGLIVPAIFFLTSIFQHEADFSLLFLAYSILLAGWIAGGDAE